MARDVLAAAAKVFRERGYAGASMRDVAQELGIRNASVYYYVDSKEELLFRVLAATCDDLDRIRAEVDALDELGALARLKAFVRRSVEYGFEAIDQATVYYREIDRLGVARRGDERYVAQLIAQAQAAGEAEPGRDAELLALNVLAMIAAAVQSRRDDHGRVADACAQFALRGTVGAPSAPV
jgi:AcrR family transcriptional regulator